MNSDRSSCHATPYLAYFLFLLQRQKYPDRSNLTEKWFIMASSWSLVAGKSQLWEPEAASHTASTKNKQNSQSAKLHSRSKIPGPGQAISGFSASINTLKITDIPQAYLAISPRSFWILLTTVTLTFPMTPHHLKGRGTDGQHLTSMGSAQVKLSIEIFSMLSDR